MAQSNRYDPDNHDEYITCPRNRCAARNAPQSADEFRGSCWKCDASLPREHPVNVGDEVVVDVVDMHESGAGVGRTDDGFVILIDGLLPETTARVKVVQLRESHALGELIEKVDSDTSDVDAEEDEEDEDDEPSLGRRDNYWG